MTARDQSERLNELCTILEGISLNDIPANKAAPIIKVEGIAVVCKIYAEGIASGRIV